MLARSMFLTLALAAVSALAQPSTSPPDAQSGADVTHPTTVRGCLSHSRGNYVLIEDATGLPYVLKGVGNKLHNQVHHQIEVKGQVLPGRIKTGIRPEKAGSNPSDTVHDVDGVPLQVKDAQVDIRTISDRCKAADQQ